MLLIIGYCLPIMESVLLISGCRRLLLIAGFCGFVDCCLLIIGYVLWIIDYCLLVIDHCLLVVAIMQESPQGSKQNLLRQSTIGNPLLVCLFSAKERRQAYSLSTVDYALLVIAYCFLIIVGY